MYTTLLVQTITSMASQLQDDILVVRNTYSIERDTSELIFRYSHRISPVTTEVIFSPLYTRRAPDDVDSDISDVASQRLSRVVRL